MSISITLIGEQKHKILRRNGAKINDDIYVTGIIGSARAPTKEVARVITI